MSLSPQDGRLRSVHRMRVSVGLVPGTGDLSLSCSLSLCLAGWPPSRMIPVEPAFLGRIWIEQEREQAGKGASERASERASVGASRTDQPASCSSTRHPCVRCRPRLGQATRLFGFLARRFAPSVANSAIGPQRDHRCSFVRSFVRPSFLPSSPISVCSSV